MLLSVCRRYQLQTEIRLETGIAQQQIDWLKASQRGVLCASSNWLDRRLT